MKYGWVVHSLTDLAKSSSWGCPASRVSVTICCAGTATAASTTAIVRKSARRRAKGAIIGDSSGGDRTRGRISDCSGEQGGSDLGPLALERHGRHGFFRASIPVRRVTGVAFLAVQVRVHPRAFRIRD